MEEEVSAGLTNEDLNRKRNLMFLGLGVASYLVYTKYNKNLAILLGVGGFIFIDFSIEMSKELNSK